MLPLAVLSLSHPSVVVIGFCLFCLGILGVLTRRHFIVVLLSLELLFAGAALNFVAFSDHLQDAGGHVIVLIIIAVAAGEAAVGLALLLAMFRQGKSVQIDQWDDLKG